MKSKVYQKIFFFELRHLKKIRYAYNVKFVRINSTYEYVEFWEDEMESTVFFPLHKWREICKNVVEGTVNAQVHLWIRELSKNSPFFEERKIPDYKDPHYNLAIYSYNK